MRRWAIAAGIGVLALALWIAVPGSHEIAAPAQPVTTNPWARGQMSVLGKVTLRDGLDVFVVHIPSYPLPLSCVVLSGPQSSSIQCDDDLAGTPPAPDSSAP